MEFFFNLFKNLQFFEENQNLIKKKQNFKK